VHATVEFTRDVRRFGAKGDGVTIDTAAIQGAIDACDDHGGGTVVVPPGRYACGTIHLHDNLELQITTGATLVASKDDELFDPPERVKYLDAQGGESAFFHHALLAGDDIENVRITGGGCLDDERLRRHGPKPIGLKGCNRVTIRDVTSFNSPNYAVSLGNCEGIDIENVRVFTSNADGIDLESCRNARVHGCHVESRDDAMVLKGSLAHGKPIQSSNIVISNCDLSTSCVGFKIGSETNGDFKNIVLANSVIHPLGIARPPLAGIAIESVDGGTIKGLAISNIAMDGMKSPLFIRLGKRLRGNIPDKPGGIADVLISNITATNSHFPVVIAGLPDKAVERVTLTNVHFEFDYSGVQKIPNEQNPSDADLDASRPPGTTNIARIPENEARYPDIRMFGDPLPTWGIFARHASGIRFSGVECYLHGADPRPSSLFIDVARADLDGLHFSS